MQAYYVRVTAEIPVACIVDPYVFLLIVFLFLFNEVNE